MSDWLAGKVISLGKSNGLRYGRLDDFLFLKRGFDITVAAQREGAVPVVSSSGLTSYHDRAMVKGPGVIIGRKGKLGGSYYIESDFWPHDTTLWVADFKGNDPKFIAYFLKWLRLERFDAATSVPTLNRNSIHPMRVGVPAIPEQRQIAKILDTLDGAIISSNASTQKLLNVRRGVLEDLLQYVMSSSEQQELVAVCTNFGDYGSNSAAIPYDDRLPRYVRITDIDDFGGLRADSRVSIGRTGVGPYLLADGDLLLARTGFTTGKPYLYRQSDGECAFAGYLVRFRPDRTLLLPQYLFLWTQSVTFSRWVNSTIREVGQRNISAREYSRHLLPVPYLERQREIVDRIRSVDDELRLRREITAKLELLKQGLMDDLLSGRVRVSEVVSSGAVYD